jgi:hypothetical protein
MDIDFRDVSSAVIGFRGNVMRKFHRHSVVERIA